MPTDPRYDYALRPPRLPEPVEAASLEDLALTSVERLYAKVAEAADVRGRA